MTGESPLDRFRLWYRALPPAMRLILTTHVAVYLVWIVAAQVSEAAQGVGLALTLRPSLPGALLQPWQFVTYSLIHLDISFFGLIGFAFNMLWLYWIGREYEETHGSHRFFGLVVLSILGGGVLAALLGTAAGGGWGVVWGATPAVLGVLFAIATLYPTRGIGLLFLGVIPIKWVAVGFLVLVCLFSLGAPWLLVTYLGAAGTGVVFARAQQRGTDLAAWAKGLFPSRTVGGAYGARRESSGGFVSRMKEGLSRRAAAAEQRLSKQQPSGRPKGGPKSTPKPPGKRRPAPKRDAPAVGIDEILDKINERGYDALTEEEKRILYEASQQ